MAVETQSVVVAIIARDSCRLGTSLDEDTAITLVAVASEDPLCWEDIVACWPRYRTPPVAEFADSLPLEDADFAVVRRAVDQQDSWIVIDLEQKRIVTGRDVELIGRDQAFAMAVDESGKQRFPLFVHLPPWWELHEQVEADVIERHRECPPLIPKTNRPVLFGEPLLNDLATRILEVARSDNWLASGAIVDESARYAFTKQVHREWLMTPRKDLGGQTPRQMLHGAHNWLNLLIDAQRFRHADGGEIVAAPLDLIESNNVPMGSEEVVIYFDLCRELIAEGWNWCVSMEREVNRATADELIKYLEDVKQQWLASPFEGGSPPRFIIECSRRRVPRGAGVPIQGMTERQTEEHVIDCDCPICNMMADGMFGPAFAQLDGHHLDLDEDFAFSMLETREEWEKQQREYAEWSKDLERRRAEREAHDQPEPDPFASPWSGLGSDEPIPGDSQGHLMLAFLLAEIVGVLQTANASSDEIKMLNDCFRDFRLCDHADRAQHAARLGTQLEKLAEQFPELVSRAADLQSRLAEQIRS